MNIYIAEDDLNIVNILRRIINDRNLGNVVGFAMDGISAKKEILELNLDIVLVDLLMPGKDGIHLVKEIKEVKSDIEFIMISQVSSKDMIGKAYQHGVEYYVYKPINALEIENIIRKVSERINLKRAIGQIQRLVKVDDIKPSKVNNNKNDENKIEWKINKIMQRVGIIGEAGSKDIIDVVSYLVKNHKNMNDFTITELLENFTDQTKSMEQRIRRTATVGLINLANLGIEDYMNETFVEYSNGLYSFEQVKIEMDYIRGKGRKRGKVNLKKFLDGMVFYIIED